MAVLGDELTLVYHYPFAEGKNVYIVIPPTDISSAGTQEFDLLMNKARTLDYRDCELKAYLFLLDLIPALEQDCLKKPEISSGRLNLAAQNGQKLNIIVLKSITP